MIINNFIVNYKSEYNCYVAQSLSLKYEHLNATGETAYNAIENLQEKINNIEINS